MDSRSRPPVKPVISSRTTALRLKAHSSESFGMPHPPALAADTEPHATPINRRRAVPLFVYASGGSSSSGLQLDAMHGLQRYRSD